MTSDVELNAVLTIGRNQLGSLTRCLILVHASNFIMTSFMMNVVDTHLIHISNIHKYS